MWAKKFFCLITSLMDETKKILFRLNYFVALTNNLFGQKICLTTLKQGILLS